MGLEQLWSQSGLLFGKMWEDPEVERNLMRQDNARKVLCIASAGDTAFALASTKGTRVTAFDISSAQIHLCRLKQALLEVGTLPTALTTDARRLLEHVEPLLDDSTREYWRRHKSLLKNGITMCGRVDLAMKLWGRLFRLFLVSESKVREMLSSDDPERQRFLFKQEWDSQIWRWAFRIALHPMFLNRVYPKEFVRLLPANLTEVMRHRMEAFLTNIPARSNPYAWQTFLPQEPTAPRPPYLEQHGSVTFQVGTISSAVRTRVKFDFFALSNILEVASAKDCSATLAAVKALARPGALVVLRFMFPRPPVWPEAEHLETESLAAKKADRAFFCNEFQIYRMG
jgi:S-adenosylmethionine:diacylglycerol 3-amino-3-carboxypropyl transferase